MKKKYVLFDLDGTLTDSQDGIINSILYCLNAFGFSPPDREELRPWLGPPLKDSLMIYYGLDEAKALDGVLKFREYFNRQGMFENKVYEGVERLLTKLKDRGYHLMVATSKPEPAARQILKHFKMDSYFTYIGGASLDDSRTAKADVIRYVLDTNDITDLESVMMVGDREHDVLGAKEIGIEVIGVLYGYGDEPELVQAGATYIAESVEDVLSYL